MAEATAKLGYFRMSASKVRLISDIIKGRPVGEAIGILQHSPKKAARALKKLLESAVANAGENHDLDVDALYVKNVLVDQGLSLKRFRPRAMGRATPVKKRTSKITIIVAEKE